MLNQLSAMEKIAVAVASSVLAGLALVVCLNLTITQSYSDFVVGSIAWRAEAKLQDMVVAPVSIAMLFFSGCFLAFQVAKQKQQFGGAYSAKLSDQLIWWSLPATASISSLVMGAEIDRTLFYLSAAGLGFVAITTSVNSFNRVNVSPEVLSCCAFAIVLIGLIPLELALIIGRASTTIISKSNRGDYLLAAYAIIGFGLIFGLLNAMWRPERLIRFLPKLLLVAQIGLPALFLTIYPASLLQPNGTVSKYQTTFGLKILIGAMIVCGIFDVIHRYRTNAKNISDGRMPLFSPTAFFALLVTLTVGNTLPPAISPDDYHFGESLVGWWSYLTGTIPYVEYIPPHGLIDDDLRGALSLLFYDGSAASISEVGRISFVLLAFAGFFSIYRFTGSLVLAFVSIYFVSNTVAIGGGLKWTFFIPFLCVWFSRSLLLNPARWLSVWLLTIPIVILAVPPQGLLLVAASSVVAAHTTWKFWRTTKPRKWTEILLTLGLLSVLTVLTPLLPMLIGALRYVFENGLINQIAYGIPWERSLALGAKSGLVFEAFRMSWVVIPLVCLGVILSSMKNSRDIHNTLSIPAIVIFLFSLLLIPYAMGRIDPAHLSRPGIYAIFAWAILLPIALWRQLARNLRVGFILLIVVMSSALTVNPISSLRNLKSSISASVETGVLRDVQAAGMPNIGLASVEVEHWNGLVKLNALLNNKIPAGETYIDLTGRHAQYFYLNRKPKVVVTAPYNMAPPQQQWRAVKELARDLPRVALLQSNRNNLDADGGGVALRNPYLYRFIIANYVPSYEDGFIFGMKKSSVSEVQSRTINIAVKDFTDVNWDRGINRGQPAIIVADPAILSLINVGDQVRMGVDELRRVAKVSTEGASVWFEGTAFQATKGNDSTPVELLVSTETLLEYRAALFQRAFSTSDLRKIPVAWGRSIKSLDKKMTLVKEINEALTSYTQVIPENSVYKVTGVDPALSFDLVSLNLSGGDAGLLKFDFSCINKSVEPRIQIFWWGDGRSGPNETNSIRFTADDGTLIIPLDSDPRWLTLKKVKGIRIDLDNASACGSFRVRNIGLFQRIVN
jgi:hypothetical protein